MNLQESNRDGRNRSDYRGKTPTKDRARTPFRTCSSIHIALHPVFLFLPLALSCSLGLPARASSSPSSRGEREESAQQLVRDVVFNEIQAQTHDHSHWRFHETQWKDAARKLYDVIQTKYGDLHRLLAVNGSPLKGRPLEAENDRLRQLSSEPDQVEEAQKKRDADAKQERAMLRMLPHAFVFHAVSREGDMVKLSFAPDPSFHPSSHQAEVFHHMEGTMLVNNRMKRLVQIDGHLTSRVNFWGGLLGHLDKGGTFKVEQRDVGDGHWDMVFLNVNMNGKALFFKTIAVRQHETYSDYHRVPDDMSLQQAARELKKDAESNERTAGK
jgi:hypothetical protein